MIDAFRIWILSGFAASAAASTLADLLENQIDGSMISTFLRIAGRTGSTLLGMPFHNYTGVLIGASVIPVWNNRIRSLPREFGMSGLQSAVGLLELAGETDSSALNALALVAAAFETWEGVELLGAQDRELDPTKRVSRERSFRPPEFSPARSESPAIGEPRSTFSKWGR